MISINHTKSFITILSISLILSIGINCWLTYQLSTAVKAYQIQILNTKVLSFTRMFVEEVLMAEEEISFDTRLGLETAVRNLEDEAIFVQWQRFTKATTKEGASNEVKILLDLLVNKIKR